MKELLVFDPSPDETADPLHRVPDGWKVQRTDRVSNALAALSKHPFDAVIASSVRPTVDTLQVLLSSKEYRPEAIRILATQELGQGTVSLSSVAHHHMFTPVDAVAFTTAVDRASRTRDRLAEVRIKLVANSRPLPSFPNVYTRITEELQNGSGDLVKIANIAQTDPGLTAKVLQLVNSPFYGLRNPVTDMQRAIGLLGIQSLLGIVLATEVFSEFEAEAAGVNISRLWSHSALVAQWAKRIAELEGATSEEANEAFVAGMLHDSGRLLLASSFQHKHAEMLARVQMDDAELIEAERSMLGASHDEVGGMLLQNWNLPTRLVEAVAYHHRPSESGCGTFTPLTPVHVAEHFHAQYIGGDVENDVPLDMDYLDEVGVVDEIDAWRARCDIE